MTRLIDLIETKQRCTAGLCGAPFRRVENPFFGTLADCEKVRKTSNPRPSAYTGTGTFASVACGGCSEQKGVAAVEIL